MKHIDPIIYLVTDNTGEQSWTTDQDYLTDENDPQTYMHSSLYAEREARVFEFIETLEQLRAQRDELLRKNAELAESLEWVLADYDGICREGFIPSANWRKRIVKAGAALKFSIAKAQGATMTLRDEFEKEFPVPVGVFWNDGKRSYSPSNGSMASLAYTRNKMLAAYQSAHAKQQKRIDELEAELAEVKRNAHAYLSQASEDVAGWGAYASDYFQNKHGLAFDIKLYQQRAEEFITATAQEGKDES